MRRLTRRQQLSTAVLAVLALLFISLDFTGGSFADARGGVSGALGSLYRGTDSVSGRFAASSRACRTSGATGPRSPSCSSRIANCRSKLAAAQADRADRARSWTPCNCKPIPENWKVLPARVIGTGPGAGFQWTLTLDVGSREHVLAGQTVTDGVGLVGRVLAVHSTTSVVLLAADPTSGVGVRDTRTGELLLATGRGADRRQRQPDRRPAGRAQGRHPGHRTDRQDHLRRPACRSGTVSSVSVGLDGTVTAALTPDGRA